MNAILNFSLLANLLDFHCVPVAKNIYVAPTTVLLEKCISLIYIIYILRKHSTFKVIGIFIVGKCLLRVYFFFWYFVLYFIKYRFSTYFSFSFSLLFFLFFFPFSAILETRKEIFSRN